MKNRLRLASGLILFAFVVSHLLNHVFGLISVHAMNQATGLFLWLWRTPAGTALLTLAVLVHVAVALHTVYMRRTLRMPVWESLQMGLGLLIPVLLIEHVLATRVAELVFGTHPDYRMVLVYYSMVSPLDGGLQATLLLVAWGHACIGLHFWLRMKRLYRPLMPYALALAVMVPTLALAGFVSAGVEVQRNAARWPHYVERSFTNAHMTDSTKSSIETGAAYARVGFAGLVLLILGARTVRDLSRRWRRLPRVTVHNHPNALIVRPGATVLETLRVAGIPIASVCGGRARCSTCRIRIKSNRGDLPAAEAVPRPEPLEAAVLARIDAPPGVRLACQLRPAADLHVTPLLPPTLAAASAFRTPAYVHGQEREIAILFADLRGFTHLASTRLPYDVVYVLNQYFAASGRAIEAAGGHLDKFIGDGIMALFGIESGPAEGARQALDAAARIAAGVDAINHSLQVDLPEPLRIGVGIHLGPVIVGEMGYGRTKSITAIGDAVNTASRLEGLTKQFGVELVISEEVAARAGLDLSAYPLQETSIRGKDGAMQVRAIERAQDLTTLSLRPDDAGQAAA